MSVRGQLVLEVKEFAFHFAKRSKGLRIGIDIHVPGTAIHHDLVARFDDPHQSFHAGDGRDAPRAGDDGGMTGLTAALGDDSLDLDFTECHGLTG